MKELNLDIFPKVSKQDWLELAKDQLKGEDPIEHLGWLSDGNIKMEPYYDESDIEGLSSQINFFESTEPFHWKLYEQINVNNEQQGNRDALEALSGGCDGIIFSLTTPVDFEKLLKGILLDICDVSLTSSFAIEDIPQSLNGFVLTCDQATTLANETSASHVDFITKILKDHSSESHIMRNASSDFFLEVASIRALRFLLSEDLGKDTNKIQIHTTIPLHQEPDQQWFFNSTAGLASILGGTNSICFSTADGDSRISRNVGNIIREESGITQYTDQCGGAFYVEVLTHKIIEACRSNLKHGSNG
ncbi:MAG: methylmalonyl-CoA mutase family protein [Cyclobacteriaceae bacterium]